MSLATLLMVILALSGWLLALAVFGCYRAMRGIANERTAEVRQLKASHDERLATLRAEREERARADQLERLELARRAIAPSRYGGVSRW